MVLLCDNDIVLKLAAFGLLDDVVQILSGHDIFVLETARHRLRRPGRSTRQRYSAEVIEAALEWTEAANTLTEAVSPADADALARAEYENDDGDICRIDGGELVLISHCLHLPESLLLTGDKKCLHALGCHRHVNARAREIHAGLQNRVITLESTLKHCITTFGFEQVRARVSPHRDCDSMTRVVFASGQLTQESNAAAALISYMEHLELSVGAGWLWHPEVD